MKGVMFVLVFLGAHNGADAKWQGNSRGMVTMAVEQTVHGQAVRLGMAAVVGSLQDTLGQRLVAVVAGVRDAKAVGKWARGERIPHPSAEQRLRHAYQITQLLMERESPDTVRAWFIGMNPDLEDQAPVLVLPEDPIRVLQAARSFLAHG
jgi:hypothetical protein